MIDLRNASLLDFLPESIASDADVIALCRAIDPRNAEVSNAILEAIILPRIGQLDEQLLNELAWSFNLNSLQIWDTATVAGKRALLVNIFAIRKKSGTRFAVRRVFDLMSVVGTVVEWFEEGAAPYTYRLRLFVDEVGITLSQLVQISELTHRFARASAQLSEFAVESNRTAPIGIASAPETGRHVEISFGAP
jgi:phage tail P2-like protein